MIETFDKSKHLDLIDGWVRARGMGNDAGDVAMLPPTGFVVDGICAGFLYRTDATLAYVGSIVSDPASGYVERGGALDALLDVLSLEARKLGYAAIAGTPTVARLVDRFEAHGFTVVPGSYAIRRV